MNGDDLQSIGITAFGVRHRLLKRIRELVQGNNEGKQFYSFYQLVTCL